MQISRVHIKNFRSIKDVSFDLGDTTVFIGPNNAGKSAILDAIKIALSRNAGFSESDVHLPNPNSDPRIQEPTSVELIIIEPVPYSWGFEIDAILGDRLTLYQDQQRRMIDIRVIYNWNKETESFETRWQFLNSERKTISEYRQSNSFSRFFNYLPIFWLDPLRDAKADFRTSNSRWTRLLEGVQIPEGTEKEVLQALSQLDDQIIAADAQLADIAGTIGEATSIAINNDQGSAKLYSLPQSVQELLSRVGIIMRNDEKQPWLPLLKQGQGLQSLSIIFLLKAIVQQRKTQTNEEIFEPIFAIEEPEAHLHPHAVRTLWQKLLNLPGQKFFTTHSPYFVQNVSLTDLNIVRLEDNQTKVFSLPKSVVSELPWNKYVETLSSGKGTGVFFASSGNNFVVSKQSFSEDLATKLKRCYRKSDDVRSMDLLTEKLRYDSRNLLSQEELRKFQSKGQRNLGEILFARRWVLVEGELDYLLLRALSIALDYPFDEYGISIINFQQSSGLGVFVSLAEALRIPWFILSDGDDQKERFIKELNNRGFRKSELDGRYFSLDDGLTLESQLVADGNSLLLKSILNSLGENIHDSSDNTELLRLMKNHKIKYMIELCFRITENRLIGNSMPKAFIEVIEKLREYKG